MERLLFYSDKWLKMLDNTIIRTDLAALPGDENLVPDKMSLKRLKKNRRKREAEAKANPDAEVVLGPATKVLRPRTWPGLPLGEFTLPPKPEWLAKFEAEAGGAGGEGEGAAAAGDGAGEGEEGARRCSDAVVGWRWVPAA